LITSFKIKVVYPVPATGSRSPGIACWQCAMIGWHVACYWVAGNGGRGRWEADRCYQDGINLCAM